MEENYDAGTGETTVANANGMGANGWCTIDATPSLEPEYEIIAHDPNGNTLAHYEQYYSGGDGLDYDVIDAYGNVRSQTYLGNDQPSSNEDADSFGGQWGEYTDVGIEASPGTSLLCLTNRYYDPAAGRFLNRDPSDYSGGINLYEYAGNNPVNRSDPSGLDGESWWDRFIHIVGAWLTVATRPTGSKATIATNYSQFGDPNDPNSLNGDPDIGGVIAPQVARQNTTMAQAPGEINQVVGGVAINGLSGVGGADAEGIEAATSEASSAAAKMTIHVGPGQPFHVVWQVGDDYRHAAGSQLGNLKVLKMRPRDFEEWKLGGRVRSFSVPIRNPSAALKTGMRAKFCFSAAISAFFRGWFGN